MAKSFDKLIASTTQEVRNEAEVLTQKYLSGLPPGIDINAAHISFTPGLHKELLTYFIKPPTKIVQKHMLMYLMISGDSRKPLGDKIKDARQIAIIYNMIRVRKGQQKGVLKPEILAL